jgi:hypothetical protein
MVAVKMICCALSLPIMLSLIGSPGHSEAVNLQCTAIGSGDIVLMRARFTATRTRLRAFSAEVRAKGRFGAGRRMMVVAAGVPVGDMKLKTIVGGDVAGELQLDDNIIFGQHTKTFPPEFPKLGNNAKVGIESSGKPVLSCRLE